MSPPNNLRLALLTEEDDIRRAVALEAASYPADEAATESGIRFRQKNAGPFFWVAYLPKDDQESETLVGFVNGTLAAKDELDDKSMGHHDPHGSLLCIHSVVVDQAFHAQAVRGRHPRLAAQVKRIMLISKANLVGFYVNCGFSVTRLSPVVHGHDPWLELSLDCEKARLPQLIQVDAFSGEPFQGNPAAVVLLSPAAYHKDGASEWMQRVAIENNLSETAYVALRERTAQTPNDVVEYDLRWFTPGMEVKLCGHATLSTAFALYDTGRVTTSQTLHFHTLSGVLVCRFEVQTETHKVLVLMDFPEQPTEPAGSTVVTNELASALGIQPNAIVDVKRATTDLLVRVTPEAFPTLKPDFVRLAKYDVRGVGVTAEALTDTVDIQSRFFAPRGGVNEDPVTGSAHCAFGPYWAPMLKKTTIKAQQFTPIRGGYITLDLVVAGPGRVLLKGEGIVVLRGQLSSSP
ncbi:Acyl-CoA N-acyltransferase [Phytophthora cactorum]|nr:Acyl-CoA N-acyltransferase [Phytophthora cactorum]